jgi:adenine deaminase
LKVQRIDHGNRALEDPALVARIVHDGLTLTVCPLSNLSLCVVKSLDAHPLRTMLQAGLKATINSDDPAYFGGYLNANWEAITQALDLSAEELVTLATNSFAGSFLDEDSKALHIAEIHRVAAGG